MARYAMLLLPSANRVYGKAAPVLAANEVRAVDELALGGRIERVTEVERGGVRYLDLHCPRGLDDRALAVVSNVSALYALFEVRDQALVPCPLRRLAVLGDDIVTIQRYVGKTNEQFTKLMVNLAMVASRTAMGKACAGQRIRLLDPLAGRGTTLNQALLYGFDAVGVEIDNRDVSTPTPCSSRPGCRSTG